MKRNNLIVMAGGASSRMKRSLEEKKLHGEDISKAENLHKSLIPLGKKGNPLLFYLLQNAIKAAYGTIYLITAPQNQAFKDFLDRYQNDFQNLDINFALQHVPTDREKPLGTADALQQCLEQFPALFEEQFTVCNGDNLYSVGALQDLREQRLVANALISYARSGLRFSDERIAKFALMDISDEGFLKGIVEKPKHDDIDTYRDAERELRVSMNIFSFLGSVIYPYLKNCPINPERGEKELPEAVRNMVAERSDSMVCIPRSEHIPDLTDANDIRLFDTMG